MSAMWSESRELASAPRRDSQKQSVMSLRFENGLLDLWFEGSHHANPHEHGAEAKSKSMTSRDQVMAVVQALERQQGEATGTSLTPAEPINEVARAFLLSTSKQNARIQPSPTQNTAIPPSATLSYRIKDPGQLAANDSLIKSRYASTILRIARASDRETAARLVRGISRDFPLHSEIPEIADIHRRAIASFDQLATSLVDAANPVKQQPLWKAALDAAAEWLRAVQTSSDNSAASRQADAAQ
jgi:hypothetical protein